MDDLRVPARFKPATMATLDKETFRPVFEYLAKLPSHMRNGVGICLSGPSGIGKTWTLAAMTREVKARYEAKNAWFDYEFITAPEMFERIPVFESSANPHDERRSRTWFATFTKVPYLVINDLGKELRSGGLHEQVVYKLGRVLRARSEYKLVTHMTTNLPLKAVVKNGDSIQSVYGESITSLMAEMMKSYHVNGSDRRRRR